MRRICIVGGGPAAVWAAIEAKKKDPSAEISLLTEECLEPYEKPPLSKSVLQAQGEPQSVPIAGKNGLAAHGVKVLFGEKCIAIDRATRRIKTGDAAYSYDSLVLATGALLRELPLLPAASPAVHYLRTWKDAVNFKTALAQCRKILVVGAGLIGLEIAATAAERGISVTVLEAAGSIMARACCTDAAAILASKHKNNGVDIRLNVVLEHAVLQSDGAVVLSTEAGETFSADAVVVGVGVIPDDSLARAAGLSVGAGIIVDERCRTSDPHIFAAGDVTCFPGRAGNVRLENWRHAIEQGTVAGRNAAGGDEIYQSVPSFWSEQFDVYVQGIGWPDPGARQLRRGRSESGALFLEIKDRTISYAVGLNTQRDMGVVKRLIERRIKVDELALQDAQYPLADLLKSKSG